MRFRPDDPCLFFFLSTSPDGLCRDPPPPPVLPSSSASSFNPLFPPRSNAPRYRHWHWRLPRPPTRPDSLVPLTFPRRRLDPHRCARARIGRSTTDSEKASRELGSRVGQGRQACGNAGHRCCVAARRPAAATTRANDCGINRPGTYSRPRIVYRGKDVHASGSIDRLDFWRQRTRSQGTGRGTAIEGIGRCRSANDREAQVVELVQLMGTSFGFMTTLLNWQRLTAGPVPCSPLL